MDDLLKRLQDLENKFDNKIADLRNMIGNLDLDELNKLIHVSKPTGGASNSNQLSAKELQ